MRPVIGHGPLFGSRRNSRSEVVDAADAGAATGAVVFPDCPPDKSDIVVIDAHYGQQRGQLAKNGFDYRKVIRN